VRIRFSSSANHVYPTRAAVQSRNRRFGKRQEADATIAPNQQAMIAQSFFVFAEMDGALLLVPAHAPGERKRMTLPQLSFGFFPAFLLCYFACRKIAPEHCLAFSVLFYSSGKTISCRSR
jgi:hypothetical protein